MLAFTLRRFARTLAFSNRSILLMSPPAATTIPVSVSAGASKKRLYNEGKRHFKARHKKQKVQNEPGKDGSNEDVLLSDVLSMLKLQNARQRSPTVSEAHSKHSGEFPVELDVHITELSSTGDGLALEPSCNQVLVVPFSLPGDVATVRIFKQNTDRPFLLTDLVNIVKASPKRNDDLVKCPYFATCSGCQFQMLSYNDQLAHKKRIVEKAYQNFSGLNQDQLPSVGDTIGSPLQYGYRTKLTPHFDGPQGGRRARRNGEPVKWTEVPPIGFMKKGTRDTIDIEDCPIGTDAVRKGMKREKKRVAEQINTYKRGATILLRENTERIPRNDTVECPGKAAHSSSSDVEETPEVIEDNGQYLLKKTCITDHNATSTEYVDDFVFTNPAGAFFQNNNSILIPFTAYIRSRILHPEQQSSVEMSSPKITNLVDAYSGSGLFTITLFSIFKRSIGIDISPSSIDFANKNAKLNNLDPSHATFRAADAPVLFADINFPGDETVVVLDPPRKGCDESFLRQLIRFGPARIVYVSCNVHTQARDVGSLVNGMDGVDGGLGAGVGSYKIESLQGFDFFPQTGHVEGVAILSKKTNTNNAAETTDS
ncbi:MAG: tRNA(m5U54)methyltransferase [Bogoriella megaspora]|nr:MAG: tRNA(m5U54)methyltransferase [Bogoriella megaspora]